MAKYEMSWMQEPNLDAWAAQIEDARTELLSTMIKYETLQSLELYDYDLACVIPQQQNRYDWIVAQDPEEEAYAQFLDEVGEGARPNRFRAVNAHNQCPNCQTGDCTGKPFTPRRISCDTTGYSITWEM